MASFEDLMIGFNDNGYNTVDSFVDRTKELPTKNVSIYEIDFNPLNDANDSEEDKIENAEKIHEQGMVYTPLHVYRNKSHRHGSDKKYMLLGGHFRLDALLRNAEVYPDAQKMVPVIVLPTPENETKELSQMEQDANYIKSTISFIKPINGKISSAFGWRNPTTETVPKNHTGTDIAAETGTKIISATDGNVILSSTTGDYGKHLKIQINDVVIVYAHCSKLYVNEGDTIKQGQEIAEVGSTGNATGPHLHFEVRYQDRYVNPQLILEL